MGLDMYLFRRKKDAPEGIEEEVAYWRKANQIRGWFDEHVGVENCKYVPVTAELLTELRADCSIVLQEFKLIGRHEIAERVLPTTSGFFFGGTEFDEYYYDDLSRTIEMIDNILESTDWETEDIFYYEWW